MENQRHWICITSHPFPHFHAPRDCHVIPEISVKISITLNWHLDDQRLDFQVSGHPLALHKITKLLNPKIKSINYTFDDVCYDDVSMVSNSFEAKFLWSPVQYQIFRCKLQHQSIYLSIYIHSILLCFMFIQWMTPHTKIRRNPANHPGLHALSAKYIPRFHSMTVSLMALRKP